MKRIFFILNIIFLLSFFNVYAEGEATLKNIRVNGVECTCHEYICNAEVDGNNATITYDKEDSEASIDRPSGTLTSFEGEETIIDVKVTNNENINTYRFIIKKHVKNTDYSLKELQINEEKIELLEDIYVYNLTVDYDVTKIVVKAKCNDNMARINGSLTHEFSIENTTCSIDIPVVAENGDSKDYRVFITRGEKPDTSLKSLKVSPGDISFSKDELEYSLDVEYSVKDILIEAVANNKDAKVEIKKDELKVGENTIEIKVSLDKVSTSYLIYVYREENIDKSLANLKKLEVKEKNFSFEPNVLEYNLKFKKIPEKLKISYEAVNEDAIISINGNENLKDGSVITIESQLEEAKIKRVYTLNISEIQEKENKKIILISIIGLSITTIVMLILEIRDRKKNRSKKKKNSKKENAIINEEIEII